MRILHTIASMQKSSGGPSYMLARLCDRLDEQGASVQVVQSLKVRTSEDVELHNQRITVHNMPTADLSAKLEAIVREIQPDLIHTHGLWLPINRASSAVAAKLNIPLVWTTHGMLRPWALNHKKWKKKLAWWLYQRRQLLAANLLHATCVEERVELQAILPNSKIAIVPIGVDVPQQIEPLTHPSGKRVMLFMGRLHPVKGLMNLVSAIDQLRPQDWCCVLAGPDEGGFRAELEAEIDSLGLTDWFIFTGAVSGTAKEDLFRQASLFVLPSFTENFGVVVPEALSYGCPVLTTTATPWSALSQQGCGWSIEVGVDPLVQQLGAAMALPAATLGDMGSLGRDYVQKTFAWPAVAAQFNALYAELCQRSVG